MAFRRKLSESKSPTVFLYTSAQHRQHKLGTILGALYGSGTHAAARRILAHREG